MKKKRIITAVALTVAGAALATLGFLSGAGALAWDGGAHRLTVVKTGGEVTVSETFAQGFTSVEVSMRDSTVEFVEADEWGFEAKSAESTFEWSLEEGVLRVTEKRSGVYVFMNFGWTDSYVKIFVPRGFSLDSATLTASSGTVKCRVPGSFGELNVSVSSGSISVADADCGYLSAKTSSGSIRAERVKFDRAVLRTSSGSVRMTDCEGTDTPGSYTATATSGDVRLERVNGAGDASATSGDVYVYGAYGGGTLAVTSGDVKLVTTLPESSYRVTATVGSGSVKVGGRRGKVTDSGTGGTVIVAKATSGNVTIDFGG
ncbi:MAG: DUF4097 domain-containing protein [Oscillospiraceae bacterium]|jgi:DUF4097 and DUF4098 domain-containing protein YvlB|nr:DUF4097 domain-containing protein [Oscillospiraceae bacterium]